MPRQSVERGVDCDAHNANVLVSALDTLLNTYMDRLFASREYARFGDDVRSIRRINVTAI